MAAGIKPVPVEPARQYVNSVRYYHARVIYQALDHEYRRPDKVPMSYEQRQQAWHELQAARFEYNQAHYCVRFPQFA